MSLAPIDYYDGDKWTIDEARPILQREVKSIEIIKKSADKGGMKIIDIGCGDGQFLAELNNHLSSTCELYGVDYSEYKLEKARKSTPFKFKHCNLEVGIPFENDFFDVVYSGEVIEHIYNPDFMMQECSRILKPGGLLIISTPNLQAWYNRILFLAGIQPLFYEVSTKSSLVGAGVLAKLKKQSVPVGHLRVFNRTGLRDLLEAEGFKVISVKGAIFQSLPKAVQRLDNLFNFFPGLSSNLIVEARRQK